MMRVIFTLISFLNLLFCAGQNTFYQDVFKGGVSTSGFMGTSEGVLRINVPQNSTIRKAFLICGNSFNDSVDHSIYLNNKEFTFDKNTRASLEYGSSNLLDIVSTHAIDLTSFIDESMDSVIIFSPQLPSNSYFFYQDFFLYITYDNISYPKIITTIDVVDKDIDGIMTNNHILNNPLYSKPIALSLLTGHMVDFAPDSTDVYLNNTYLLGRIGGKEQNGGSRTGVFGNFYYQNDTLYGIDDDTPDSLMNGPDALADIKNYINSPNISLRYEYQVSTHPLSDPTSNSIWATFLTYSTKCDTLKSSISISDTTICAGEVLNLAVNGEDSYTYAWRYLGNVVTTDTVLSISPNENRLYSILVTDTSGCAKTEIINIKVNQKPKLFVSQQDADCPNNNGAIIIDSVQGLATPFRYQKDNEPFQTAPVYGSLFGGDYAISVIDTNGCSSMQAITVNEINNTIANFSYASPVPFVPANITFANQSLNTSEYQWFLNNSLVSSQINLAQEFNLAGEYQIMLVASKVNEQCTDTIIKTINLEHENYIYVPSNWGEESSLSLYSIGYVQLEFRLLNSLGQVVHSLSKPITNEEEVLIGNKNFARGVYFYELTATKITGEKVELGGKVIRM